MLAAHDFTPVLRKRKSVAVALWGEAGVGKTYAATQLLKSLPCLTLSIHATTPLSDMIKTIPKPKKVATWAARPLEQLERGAPLETTVVLDALVALLSGLAPFVLHLEDMHEANDERCDFIYNLARAVQTSKGVGLLVTSRNLVNEPFITAKLEPLAPEVSERLLEAELKAPIPKEAASWIYGKAAGNPLYTLEYVRFLARQGFLWSDGSNWHWRRPEDDLMPVTVEALIEVQLAKVDTEFESALQLKAMLPVEAGDELWSRGLGTNAQNFEPIKSALNESGVMRGSSFVHPLYREVILKTLPKTQRQALARVLLEVCADDPAYISMFLEDARLERGHALSVLRGAAEQVKAEGSELLTGSLLAKAAGFAAGDERCTLALEAAKVLQTRDAHAAGEMAELALVSATTALEALEVLVKVKARTKDFDLSSWLVRVPEAVRNQLDLLRLELTVRFLNEDHPAVVASWEADHRLAEHSAPQIIASLSSVGRQDEAKLLLSGQLAGELPQTEWCELMRISALIEYREGHYQASEEIYQRLVPVAQGVASIRSQTSLLLNRALVLRNLGRFLEAAAAMEEALRLRQELGEAIAYAFVQASLGEMLTELGAYERSEMLLHEALATFRTYGRVRFLIMTEHNTGLMHAAKAAPLSETLAIVHTGAALRLAREAGETLLLTELLIESALVRCQFGHLEQALKLVSEALDLLPRAGNAPKYRARALLALGLAQEKTAPAKAKALISEAFELATGFEYPTEKHKIGLELDRLNGDLEGARARMMWFEARGLMNGVNIAKRYFPELADAPLQPVAEDLPRLEVLGTMRVSSQGELHTVHGGKRQELLALLLEARLAGRSEVSRLGLVDALYTSEDERHAVQNLKTLVHGLRTHLGGSSVTTTATGYALGALASDAEAFLETRDTRLWRGPYLEGVGIEGQETVCEFLYSGLADTAKALLETDPKEAARVGRIGLEADPYNLEYLTLCMRALRAERNHKSLGRLYAEAKTRFAEVNETLPETWGDFLA